jgi:uncharacterized protein (TIGR00255 family)
MTDERPSLSSMTGFSRIQGQTESTHWAWEFKSVNAKGFDLRLRIPQGLDGVEAEVRRMMGSLINRGTVHASLELTRQIKSPEIRINDDLIKQLLQKLGAVARDAGIAPPTMDAILAMRGVVEIVEQTEDENEQAALVAAIVESLETAVISLCASRQTEGAVLHDILSQRLGHIEELVEQAEAHPARQPDAIKERLARQLHDLLEAGEGLDKQRLHQEAMLLAVKGDIREELDRLKSHCGQVRDYLMRGGAIGRRLDFLAQELSREINTLSAKSNDVGLTKIGIDLKTLIEQFREQVQNVE